MCSGYKCQEHHFPGTEAVQSQQRSPGGMLWRRISYSWMNSSSVSILRKKRGRGSLVFMLRLTHFKVRSTYKFHYNIYLIWIKLVYDWIWMGSMSPHLFWKHWTCLLPVWSPLWLLLLHLHNIRSKWIELKSHSAQSSSTDGVCPVGLSSISAWAQTLRQVGGKKQCVQ